MRCIVTSHGRAGRQPMVNTLTCASVMLMRVFGSRWSSRNTCTRMANWGHAVCVSTSSVSCVVKIGAEMETARKLGACTSVVNELVDLNPIQFGGMSLIRKNSCFNVASQWMWLKQTQNCNLNMSIGQGYYAVWNIRSTLLWYLAWFFDAFVASWNVKACSEIYFRYDIICVI